MDDAGKMREQMELLERLIGGGKKSIELTGGKGSRKIYNTVLGALGRDLNRSYDGGGIINFYSDEERDTFIDYLKKNNIKFNDLEEKPRKEKKSDITSPVPSFSKRKKLK